MKIRLLTGVAALSLLAACSTMGTVPMATAATATAEALPPIPQATGIFAQASTLPFQAPDFDRIRDEDYLPALEQGIAIQLAEIEHIARNPEAPTFANTLVAMERTGRMFARAYAPFSQKTSANFNDVLNTTDSAISPQIAAMQDAI